MRAPALVVTQSGRITDGLMAVVGSRGHDPVETLVTDRPTDGTYYLSPTTLDDAQRWASGATDGGKLVVDGILHPGQVVDLSGRLPSVTLRDRRDVVWESLGESNPVAAARFDLRRARIARRAAAASQRDDATDGPSGMSGRLVDREQGVQARREELETRRKAARDRARTEYQGVDGYVVMLGRVGTQTTALWAALTDEPATEGVCSPTQPRTATADVGPHTLAVTDVPGVPGDGGIPEWLTAAVPGLVTALDRASCVLIVGDPDGLAEAVRGRFDVTWRSVQPTEKAAHEALNDVFGTASFAVRLPYGDDTHALVSDLHDRAAVRDAEYDDAVRLHVEVPWTARDRWRRRVSAVGGEVEPLDDGE